MTYAIAAQEGNGIHVSNCPCFVTSGNFPGISAKDMWLEIKEVFSLMYFTSFPDDASRLECMSTFMTLRFGYLKKRMILLKYSFM